MKLTIVVVIVFLVGLICGAQIGAVSGQFLDASAKGALLIHELNYLREDEIEELIDLKEIELDGAIYNHVRYMEGIYPFIMFPLDHQYDHEKYMRRVIEYRNQYPSPIRSSSKGGAQEQMEFWQFQEAQDKEKLARVKNWYE